MNSKVKVVGDPTTNTVIVQSKNNVDYGHIRVSQSRSLVGNDGFYRNIEVSALIHGYISDLKHSGYHINQELDGRIVIRESLEPFNKLSPERDLKIAGDTGVVCSVEGQPIYRKVIYTDLNTIQETLVAHDNMDEIRAANRAVVSNKAITPSEDFDI